MRTQKQQPSPTASSAIQEAAAWDSRLRAPNSTDDDRARFAVWRDADPAHGLAFERLQIITASLRHDRGRADVRALRDEALRAVTAKRRRRLFWVAAATIVLALPATVWFSPSPGWLRQPLDALIARLAGTQTYATDIGQRSTFALEDGSSVELNAQSKIRVSFTPSQRRVELLEGQAMFDVAKNPERPFTVHAGNREIIAVGTQFDVRLNAHSLQVTLIEGKVRVTSFNSAFEPKATAENPSPGSDEILLTPGKQLLAQLSGPGATATHSAVHPMRTQEGQRLDIPDTNGPETTDTIRNIDIAKATGWRDGRVFFEDQSLEDAVAEMNRYSTTRIEVGDPSLADLRVNGMFIAGGQQAFATALENYFPTIAQQHGDKEIILVRRN